MKIKQLSIFIENKQGRLAEITRLMAEAGVDLRAFSIADTSDFGILRLIADKPDVAKTALREAGIRVTVTEVLAVSVDDKPGALANVVELVSKAGISIEYIYAFLTQSPGKAFAVLRVADNDRAIEVLQAGGVDILCGKDIV